MIKNLWNVVKIVCGNHDDSTPDLVINQLTPKKLQYKCNCSGCRNAISVDDYDNAIKKISDEMEIAEFEGSSVDLKNMKWKSRGVDYKIICFKNDKIVVRAVNKKVL